MSAPSRQTSPQPDTRAAFFEAKYQAAGDPWDFASSPYERSRYAATLAALGGRRYGRAFEPGCSVGELTAGLAGLCDSVEAIDLSPTAVLRAQQRCAGLPNVRIRCSALVDVVDIAAQGNIASQATGLSSIDLLVLSEIGYYFQPSAWREISQSLIDPLPAGATVIAVHWLGSSPDHCMGGDEVHAILHANPAIQWTHGERHALDGSGFRLDKGQRR